MLNGIDVSYANGLASTAGLDFAFIRATYGRIKDRKFEAHYKNFRAAGLVTGAYAFGVNAPAAQQALAFLKVADKCDLLVLDLESDGPHRPRMTDDQARSFIAYVHQAGRTIGLYHSRSGFPNLGQDWNWIADYTKAAKLVRRPLTTRPWAFWQWQGDPLDRNKYNGTMAQLKRLTGQNIVPIRPPAPKPAPPAQTGNPYPKGDFRYVDWYHSHGFSQIGGVWVASGAPAPIPAPTPAPPRVYPPIPLVPILVAANVSFAQPSTPISLTLGGHPALRFGTSGPAFALIHGGPVPIGNPGMLQELGWRLAARGAIAYCIDYTPEPWTLAVRDVEKAIAEVEFLSAGPVTVVAHSYGGVPASISALGGSGSAYVAVCATSSKAGASDPTVPDIIAMAALRQRMPVSVVRGTADIVNAADDDQGFINALHAAGHPGLNFMGPGDHTGTLYTDATLDAILTTATMI